MTKAKKVKWVSLIFAAALILIVAAPVFADSNGATWTAKFWVGRTYYEVNGQR